MHKLQFGVSLFAVAVLLSIFLAAQSFNVFAITTIECTINDQPTCPSYLQAELNKNLGKSQFSSPIQGQLQRISTLVPSFRQYSLTQKLPHTILVNFTTNPNAYRFVSEDNQQSFTVDASGVVVDQNVEGAEPVVTAQKPFLTPLNVRSSIPGELHQALQASLNTLESQHIEVKRLTLIDQDQLELELSDGKKVLISLDSPSKQLIKLAYLIHKFDFSQIKTPVKAIDMRFKYPVLKT